VVVTAIFCDSGWHYVQFIQAILLSFFSKVKLKHRETYIVHDLLNDSPQSFSLSPGLSNQHSMTPEVAVHGFPADNFTRSGSRGINLSRLSFGLELNEPATSNWTSGTSVKFEVCLY